MAPRLPAPSPPARSLARFLSFFQGFISEVWLSTSRRAERGKKKKQSRGGRDRERLPRVAGCRVERRGGTRRAPLLRVCFTQRSPQVQSHLRLAAESAGKSRQGALQHPPAARPSPRSARLIRDPLLVTMIPPQHSAATGIRAGREGGSSLRLAGEGEEGEGASA